MTSLIRTREALAAEAMWGAAVAVRKAIRIGRLESIRTTLAAAIKFREEVGGAGKPQSLARLADHTERDARAAIELIVRPNIQPKGEGINR